MFNKKIIMIDDTKLIAIKHCDEKNICVIGGNTHIREYIQMIVKDYFLRDPMPIYRTVTKGKGRFTFSCTWEQYINSIKLMKDNFYTIQDVITHGKMMR